MSTRLNYVLDKKVLSTSYVRIGFVEIGFVGRGHVVCYPGKYIHIGLKTFYCLT